MAFKYISFFAILAVASAGTIYQAPTTVLHHYQPAAYAAYGTPIALAAPASATFLRTPLVASETPIITKKLEEIDPHVSYSFGYDVKDSITGDFKNHQERREGDLVQGQYSLLDADGYKRTVDYTADSINGFNAHVSRDPILTKTIIAEPIIKAALPTLVKSIEPAIVKTAEPTLIKAAEPTLIKTIQPTLINVAAPSIYTATHLPYANHAFIKSGYGAFDYGYGYNGYPLYPQTYFVPTLRAASSSIAAPVSEVVTAAVAAPVSAPAAAVAPAVEVN